jgi:histidine ammonia-lyase
MDPAPGTARIHNTIRTVCPALAEDRPPGPDIMKIAELIESGAFDYEEA